MGYSRVTPESKDILVRLSQTGRRAALAQDLRISVESTNRVLTNLQNRLNHGKTLTEREDELLPIVRFTTLANKYKA